MCVCVCMYTRNVFVYFQHLGETIQKTFYDNTTDSEKDRLVSMTMLRELCQKCPCDTSFKLALSWLCREKKCMVIEIDGQGKVCWMSGLCISQHLFLRTTPRIPQGGC